MTLDQGNHHAALNPRPVSPEDFTREETYRKTRVPVDLATTLLPEAYTSPDFFTIEREKVFASGWIPIGCTSQIEKPGQVIVSNIAGRPIVVARDKAGELRAFHNVCRHRAAKLLDDDCRAVSNNRIRCPYHSWTYDLEGRCLGTPLFEGSDIPEEARAAFDTSGVKEFDKADYGLIPAKADSWGFLVFVNLDTDATPLSEQLGDLPERFSSYRLHEWRVSREKTYAVEANYKLLGENFLEYYHLPWVHPELVKVSRMENHYRWQGPGMYMGFCTTPISQNTDAGGWQGLPPLNTLDATDAESGRFVWLFPNTAIAVLPNHAFVIIAHPDGASRTVEETFILSHPDSLKSAVADEELDQLARFWDVVNLEDIGIVERVQEGISDPAYRGGRMCYRFEELLHRFQNMVIDKMVGIDRVPSGDEQEMVQMFDANRSGAPDRATAS